jgi:hypothetical protein
MKYKSGTGANKAIVNNNEVLLVKYYYLKRNDNVLFLALIVVNAYSIMRVRCWCTFPIFKENFICFATPRALLSSPLLLPLSFQVSSTRNNIPTSQSVILLDSLARSCPLSKTISVTLSSTGSNPFYRVHAIK